MAIKSYRGLIADAAQEHIRLKTNTGKIGYSIVKFQIFPYNPGTEQSESTVQIFKHKQPSVSGATAIVNFSDQDLLAAAFYSKSAAVSEAVSIVTVFDQEIFNQDIYITHTEVGSTHPVNYYLELEQIKLSDNESTMATLQSIRSRYESYTPAGPS